MTMPRNLVANARSASPGISTSPLTVNDQVTTQINNCLARTNIDIAPDRSGIYTHAMMLKQHIHCAYQITHDRHERQRQSNQKQAAEQTVRGDVPIMLVKNSLNNMIRSSTQTGVRQALQGKRHRPPQRPNRQPQQQQQPGRKPPRHRAATEEPQRQAQQRQ